MGVAHKPDPATLVIAGLYLERRLLDRAKGQLEESLGPIDQFGPEVSFEWTDYYQSEMGTGLKRCFLVCRRLLARENLADAKLLTVRVEKGLTDEAGRRRVNLDPGLLTLENLVLASTKNQPQRIYLRDGIFGEVTLWFKDGDYQPVERTYAEYRSQTVRDLLKRVRQGHKRSLRAGEEPLRPAELPIAHQEEAL